MRVRVDDPFLPNDEGLWRRIVPQWVHRTEDGRTRPSSAAFIDDYTSEVSVYRSSMATPEEVLRDHPRQSLAEIPARLPRSLGYVIAIPDSDEDEDYPLAPAHRLICMHSTMPNKRRKRDARTMAEGATWVVLQDNN